MQTILGANGVIGRTLADELRRGGYTNDIRLVSRNPRRVNEADKIMAADITNPEQTLAAINGSDVVYLTAGLRYDIRVWQTEWPKIMDNVIEGCKRYNSKLVFFDNVYCYGHVDGWMTEETPYNPESKKGEVRAAIATQLITEYESGNIQTAIVRSADFYGPKASTSVFNLLAIDKLKRGQKAQWLYNAETRHSMTYSTDAAKATAIIGNTPEAFNQTWHLPTDPNALSGRDYIELAATILSIPPSFMVLKKWQLTLAGLFSTTIRELSELSYQNEYDYLFNSSKFLKQFGIKPTGYREGIESCI